MCTETDGVLHLCQEHTNEQIAAFFLKHPGVEQFYNDNKGRCSHCIAMAMDDEFGPGTGSKWRNLEWLLP